MKFIHTADLHIGKQVCEHSMIDEQRYIIREILRAVDAEKPDALLMAGDIYDKSVPSAEAVAVLDDFLVELARRKLDVFMLSGNHDSAERIAFGGRLMERSGIHVSPVYSGSFAPVTLRDSFGEIDVWMLPFVRPATVRAFLADDGERDLVTDYTSAIRMAVAKMELVPGRRNVLLSHQFVTGAERSDSEENVGGLDNVDVGVFDAFDYVALGHIHKPQDLSRNEAGVPRVRYSGTPLKYSLSEASHHKSLTVVELGDGTLDVREIPLVPQHDVREIRGSYAELVSQDYRTRQIAEGRRLDDFVYVKLTDENDIPDAAQKLRGIYPNLMMLDYDNERTRRLSSGILTEQVERKTPIELFEDFFKEMNARPMNEEEREFVDNMIAKVWEEA